MGKLTLHARIEIGLVAALLLGSCSEADTLVTHDQVVDIADDSIDASGIGGRIDDLESRVAELEEADRLNKANIATLFSNAAADRDTANDNARVSNDVFHRLEAVEARLGM